MKKPVILAAAVLGLAGASAAAAQPTGPPACERAFDTQYRQYDQAFHNRDLDRFISFYREDATKIDQDGSITHGKEAIRQVFAGMFQVEFTASFVPVKRVVAECRTALVVLDSKVSSAQFTEHFYAALTFTAERGAWRILNASSTRLP